MQTDAGFESSFLHNALILLVHYIKRDGARLARMRSDPFSAQSSAGGSKCCISATLANKSVYLPG
jgi:hypothetical protein